MYRYGVVKYVTCAVVVSSSTKWSYAYFESGGTATQSGLTPFDCLTAVMCVVAAVLQHGGESVESS